MSRDVVKALERRFGQATVVSGRSGTEIVVECPKCGHRKMWANPAKNAWHCWVCEGHGKLSDLLRIPASKLKAMKGAAPKRERRAQRGYISPGATVPIETVSLESSPGLYLMNRGFDPYRLGRVFGFEYCSAGVQFAGGVFSTSNTVVIPVVKNGVRVAWQARLLYDPDKVEESMVPAMGWKWDEEKQKWRKPPKYFTMPGFDKGLHLFNRDNASRFGFTVVTEGAFDAASVGRCAVASFGKELTDEQVGILMGWPVVVLLLDPDAASTQDSLERRLRMSGRGPKTVKVALEGYKDAGDCPHGELVGQIISAADRAGVNLVDYAGGPEDPFESARD